LQERETKDAGGNLRLQAERVLAVRAENAERVVGLVVGGEQGDRAEHDSSGEQRDDRAPR